MEAFKLFFSISYKNLFNLCSIKQTFFSQQTFLPSAVQLVLDGPSVLQYLEEK